MLTRNPKEFERVAHEWAVRYAGAPKKETGEGSGGRKTESKREKKQRSKEEEAEERRRLYVSSQSLQSSSLTMSRYGGYNTAMIDRFVFMGFDLDRVVSAFEYVGIDSNDGEDYELEEAYIGDVTARLLGEP